MIVKSGKCHRILQKQRNKSVFSLFLVNGSEEADVTSAGRGHNCIVQKITPYTIYTPSFNDHFSRGTEVRQLLLNLANRHHQFCSSYAHSDRESQKITAIGSVGWMPFKSPNTVSKHSRTFKALVPIREQQPPALLHVGIVGLLVGPNSPCEK